MDSSRSIAASTPRASSRRRTSRSARKYGPRGLGIVDRRRQQHQADAAARPRRRAPRRRSRPARLRGAPCLVASPARSTWTSSSSRRPAAAAASSTFATQRGAVDRVDRRRSGAAFLRFVRLQVADEMPPERQIGGLRPSSAAPPGLCFRRSRSGRRRRRRARLGGKCFGDGDEADGGGVAPGPAGRPRDARANVGQPGTGARRQSITISSAEPTMPFAVRGVRPVGASFR